MKALLKRFGAPGALQYLTFFFLTGATFFVKEGKADGIGAARAAAAAAVAAALTPPVLTLAVALLGGPNVNPPGGGATGGRWPKVGGGGCGGPAATGAGTGAGAGAAGGDGAGAEGATSTISSCLSPVPVLMVDESVSTLTPYLDDMSPVCMSLGTSMGFRLGRDRSMLVCSSSSVSSAFDCAK